MLVNSAQMLIGKTDVLDNILDGITKKKPVWLSDFEVEGKEYFIKGDYKKLTGILTVCGKSSEGILTVYGVGENIDRKIAEYTIDPSKEDPYEISVDMSGVRALIIQLKGAAFAEAKLYTEP